MIASVLQELRESAVAQLPSRIEYVANLRSVELKSSFTAYSWWMTETEAIKVSFPALSFSWDRTRTGFRNASTRKAKHRITASYGFRSGNMGEIERHILHVPEAVLLWLDELAIASRVAGNTIIGPDRAAGDEIEITHDLENAQGGSFIWSVDFGFWVLAQDGGLPARTI